VPVDKIRPAVELICHVEYIRQRGNGNCDNCRGARTSWNPHSPLRWEESCFRHLLLSTTGGGVLFDETSCSGSPTTLHPLSTTQRIRPRSEGGMFLDTSPPPHSRLESTSKLTGSNNTPGSPPADTASALIRQVFNALQSIGAH